MVKIEVNVNQIKKAISQLSSRERIRLVKDLNRETWAQCLNQVFTAIDQRRRKTKTSLKEIDAEVTKARREFHAHRR